MITTAAIIKTYSRNTPVYTPGAPRIVKVKKHEMDDEGDLKYKEICYFYQKNHWKKVTEDDLLNHNRLVYSPELFKMRKDFLAEIARIKELH